MKTVIEEEVLTAVFLSEIVRWNSQNFPGCQFDWLTFANGDILYYNSLHRQLLVLTSFLFFTIFCSHFALCAIFRSIEMKFMSAYLLVTEIVGKHSRLSFHVFIVLSVLTRTQNAILTISLIEMLREDTICLSSSADSHYDNERILRQCLLSIIICLKINARICSFVVPMLGELTTCSLFLARNTNWRFHLKFTLFIGCVIPGEYIEIEKNGIYPRKIREKLIGNVFQRFFFNFDVNERKLNA